MPRYRVHRTIKETLDLDADNPDDAVGLAKLRTSWDSEDVEIVCEDLDGPHATDANRFFEAWNADGRPRGRPWLLMAYRKIVPDVEDEQIEWEAPDNRWEFYFLDGSWAFFYRQDGSMAVGCEY